MPRRPIKGVTAAAEADFDRDGDADLVVAMDNVLYLYTNRGRANFLGSRLTLPGDLAAAGIGRIIVFDYNNDGRLDLLDHRVQRGQRIRRAAARLAPLGRRARLDQALSDRPDE